MMLLKRNSVERMAFDNFFNHVFMHKAEAPRPPSMDSLPFLAPEEHTPPKIPSPMQLTQTETLGTFSFTLINSAKLNIYL